MSYPVPEPTRGQSSKDYAFFFWTLTWRERLRVLRTGRMDWCYRIPSHPVGPLPLPEGAYLLPNPRPSVKGTQ